MFCFARAASRAQQVQQAALQESTENLEATIFGSWALNRQVSIMSRPLVSHGNSPEVWNVDPGLFNPKWIVWAMFLHQVIQILSEMGHRP